MRKQFIYLVALSTVALSVPFAHYPAQAAPTGAITIVQSGGAAEGTGWSFSAGQIQATANVDINSSVIESYLAQGDLEVWGTSLTVAAPINWSTGSDLSLKSESTNPVAVNADISATGTNASLAFDSAAVVGVSSYSLALAQAANITLSGTGASFSNNGETFSVVNSLDQIPTMAASGKYVLGQSLGSAATFSNALYNSATFTGVFDGLGNEISGLKIMRDDTSATGVKARLGLFGKVFGATIRNLGVTSIDIQTKSTSSTNDYRIGGIAGLVGTEYPGTYETTTVTSISGVWTSGSISTVAVNTSSSTQSYYFAGGVIGSHNNGRLEFSKSYSNTNLSSSGSKPLYLAVGGLVGDIGNFTENASTVEGTANIFEVYSTGSIVQGSFIGYYGVGGIVGVILADEVSITNSFSSSTVTGTGSWGGLVGYAESSATNSITSSYTTQSNRGTLNGITLSNALAGVTSSFPVSGTNLPTGFSSTYWIKEANQRPMLKNLAAARSPLFIQVTPGQSAGTYAAMTYRIVDAAGSSVDLQSLGLTEPTGTPNFTVNSTTPAGTYSVSYLSGLSLGGSNANLYTLNPYTSSTSYTIASVQTPQTVTWSPVNTNLTTNDSPVSPSTAATALGSVVPTYSVQSAGTTGCTVNPTSGILNFTAAGQCVIRATATANQTYAAGYKDIIFLISQAAPSAPSISYSAQSYTFTQGQAATTVSPANAGGAITSWSVAPALPAGLTLNTATGVISGTPTSSQSATTFTVTAGNVTGSSSTAISIEITGLLAAPDISYGNSSAVLTASSFASLNAPANSGGQVAAWSVAPALPAGLSLDSATGVISGIPTAAQTAINYTVTATNASGSDSTVISITVNLSQSGISGGNNGGATQVVVPKPLVPVILKLEPGTSKVLLDGEASQVTVRPVSQTQALAVEGENWKLEVKSVSNKEVILPLDSNNNLVVLPGSFAQVDGIGFKPGEQVKVYLFSTPTLLGTVFADSAGVVSNKVFVPSNLKAGNHTLQILGYDTVGNVRVTSLGVVAKKLPSLTEVSFTPNSFAITKFGALKLKMFAAQVKAFGVATKVTVTSWAYGSQGSTKANFFATRRADAVAAYLRLQGVKTVIEKKPKVSNLGVKRLAQLTVR